VQVDTALVSTPAPNEVADLPVAVNEVMAESNTGCKEPVIAPTKPAVVPYTGGVDATTGRHVQGYPVEFDLASYRLEVRGLVEKPLRLSYDDLRCLPKITETVTTNCYTFHDTATWSGVQLSEVLKLAGVKAEAQKILQKGGDGIDATVTLEMAQNPHNFLAYEMEGKPLPVLFGFPLRSIFIDVAGQYSIKWLKALEVGGGT
jgi:DMSO/TMAO reductase YedYZ molybdopterin-dependent catalytic subunit